MDQPDDVWNWDSGMAPDCAVEGGIEAPIDTEGLRGKLTPQAPLAKLVWFKTGGKADWLFEPEDRADLEDFLSRLDGDLPVMALGLGSNMIVRDGGVPGVVIKLGKPFADVSIDAENCVVECGGGAHGILVASAARDAGVAGLEFMRGIPGTVGGFVRMNGGAYGTEVADVLVDCMVIMPNGECHTLPASDLQYSYRHSALPEGAVVVSARFKGEPGDPEVIGAKMDEIAEARENSQPLRTKTGGSTFKNPPGEKAWQLVDAAGCRGLKMGGAQVSEKHTNFLLNVDNATSADIEGLGEEVKRRVYENSGVELEWEIQRVGRP
ncbi:MAG: UDP-N-acetylmuramate dehydrogenase [Erythrobacter sp.]|nr:UDP-N-acetylmuramate dehydrogenase [Erythrobacter sp.]